MGIVRRVRMVMAWTLTSSVFSWLLLMKILRDLDQNRALVRALGDLNAAHAGERKAREAAADADLKRQELISYLCHELRSM